MTVCQKESALTFPRSVQGFVIYPSRNTILAEIGSLNLEFTRLSQLTNDSKYFDAVQRIADKLEGAQMKTKTPGLWPVMINAESMEFSDPRFTVGGMADSTYEYLPKEHMLLGAQTNQYRNMYASAIEVIKDRLIFRGMTKTKKEVLFAGNANAGMSKKEHTEHQSEHLKCYLGGTVGIAAKIFQRPAEELRIARGLTDGCIWAYDSMPTGIMPETFYVSACGDEGSCEWDEQRWHGDVFHRFSEGSISEDPFKEGKELVKENKLPPGMIDITNGGYFLRYVYPLTAPFGFN